MQLELLQILRLSNGDVGHSAAFWLQSINISDTHHIFLLYMKSCAKYVLFQIFPNGDFNVEQAAEDLRKSMKGLGKSSTYI